MTTINISVLFILIMLGVLWCILVVVYLSVTSQIETGKVPEGGDILVDVIYWIPTIFKLLTFSHTSKHQPEVSFVPKSTEQAFKLPKLGTAGGPNTGTFQSFSLCMVGVDMTNVTLFLHFYLF